MKRTLLFFRALGAALVLAAELFFLSVAPVSCSMGSEDEPGSPGIKIQSAAPPVLESFTVDSADRMTVRFDKEVSVTDATLSPSGGGGGPVPVSCEDCGDGKTVRMLFAGGTEIGRPYDLNATAGDADGNSLSFRISFDGFNDRPPELILYEVRNAYSSKSNKYEFIRLYCGKGGNLSGLEVLSAGDGEAKAFAFPPVEVSAGDYVTVHLRKMKGDDGSWKQAGMTDEDSGDIRASTATDSSDDAWDFWQDNQKSRLSPSDIVMLRRRADGEVLDALLFRDPKKEADGWDGKYAPFCRAVADSGAWLDEGGNPSSDYAGAFAAAGITSSAVTRTIRRRSPDLRPSSAADWEVVQAK
ncbi:MAG: hypothetical protein IJR93_13445 [Treponema sp.]|nr:hypothetical protein [Treponema sp.]